MMDKLPFGRTLLEGVKIGLKNFFSLLGTVVLYVLTCWIPYLNVGTTIAMYSIPVELSRGHIINPLFIFEDKYRKNMGEFFILFGLMAMAMLPATLLMVVPAIVLGYAWYVAFFLFIDKDITSIEALRKSNELTDGYKWKIFGLELVLGTIVLAVELLIVFCVSSTTWQAVLAVLLTILVSPLSLGLTGMIYRSLSQEPIQDDKVEEVTAEEANDHDPTAPTLIL